MTLSLIAALALAQAPADNLKASDILSAMLSRYASAKTLTGTIEFTQKAQGVSVRFTTEIAYDRDAGKLRVKQTKHGGRTWLLISDGDVVSYDSPNQFDDPRGKRLFERQVVEGRRKGIGAVYAIGTDSLPDKSMPLDVAIANSEHLRIRRDQWATIQRVADRNEQRIIRGNWREYGTAPVTGTYEMAISPSGDLQRYTQWEAISVPGAGGAVQVESTWLVNLTVGGKPASGSFAVPR